MEDINTVVRAYPHASVLVLFDDADTLFTVIILQEMLELVTIGCLYRQVQSAAESAQPHTPFFVPIDRVNLVVG